MALGFDEASYYASLYGGTVTQNNDYWIVRDTTDFATGKRVSSILPYLIFGEGYGSTSRQVSFSPTNTVPQQYQVQVPQGTFTAAPWNPVPMPVRASSGGSSSGLVLLGLLGAAVLLLMRRK